LFPKEPHIKIFYPMRFQPNVLIPFIIVLLSLNSCSKSTKSFFHEGVSKELASYRARQIYDVTYQLHFNIPIQKDEAVTGQIKILFKPLKARHGVILDFTPGEQAINSITVNGDKPEYFILNGHIYIDADQLVPRQENSVEISFTASDQALNRSEDFLYTLFVPDRASTAFPCFDQPDIKAHFNLSLSIPAEWVALSNGSVIETSEESEERKTIQFADKNLISTYLFAFAAGDFDVISETRNNRKINLFHRETDETKLNNNIQSIFDQHFASLKWLEDYTGIPYPYEKFDIALIPGFQYSGMEHPGAIWYRDTRLLLEPNPPQSQIIRKASLISHETAHMWFGNLVTMKWFDDVWLKEVFAGFMADKMLMEIFPDQNHKLQFMLSHFPKAMSIDRSKGAHPIKQKLTNMKLAGTLYGPIIYNKAPIVFDQLEKIMEPIPFQNAVREYLVTYAHGNADWIDLVTIFDKHTEADIEKWSNAWVYGSGLHHIKYSPENSQIIQVGSTESYTENFPAQFLGITSLNEKELSSDSFWFDKSPKNYIPEKKSANHTLTLLNGTGTGYGFFELQPSDVNFIQQNIHETEDEVIRAAIYINMFENFLNNTIESNEYYSFLKHAIETESNPLLQNNLLDNLNIWAFNFPDYFDSSELHHEVESLLWNKLETADANQAGMFFESWLKLSRSAESGKKMRGLYEGQITPGQLSINDMQMTELALEASLRLAENKELLQRELDRISNPDRLKRLRFIMPAASTSKSDRDAFFENIKSADNRNPEPWVLEALYYLHHPLHKGQGLAYLDESLELLEEIQQTGDIFFPQNWLIASLGNYSTPEVANKISEYLEKHPELEENLKLKLLQSSDMIMRSTMR
jgi:aminopeptidase N